jgi:hypothetical protein
VPLCLLGVWAVPAAAVASAHETARPHPFFPDSPSRSRMHAARCLRRPLPSLCSSPVCRRRVCHFLRPRQLLDGTPPSGIQRQQTRDVSDVSACHRAAVMDGVMHSCGGAALGRRRRGRGGPARSGAPRPDMGAQHPSSSGAVRSWLPVTLAGAWPAWCRPSPRLTQPVAGRLWTATASGCRRPWRHW